MHKFNTLKYGGGGAVTLLPQHVAQRMVRHVSKRNGWNGIGRFGEKVPHIKSKRTGLVQFGVCRSRTNRRDRDRRQVHVRFWRKFCKNRIWDNDSYGGRQSTGNNISKWETPLLVCHACGGCNHLVTEVTA